MRAVARNAQAAELRGAGRQRFNVAASIHVADLTLPLPCNVIDISSQGARLETQDWPAVPDEFSLRIANNTFAARVIWRSTQELGVRFLQERAIA